MTKQDSESKKNYSNIKTIKLDPLGERLSNVDMTGGASKPKLIKNTRPETTSKGVVIQNKITLKQSKYHSDLRRYYEGMGKDPRKNIRKNK